MEIRRSAEFSLSILLLLFCNVTSSSDSISAGQSLTYGETLISKDGMFELGFFTPGNSQKYYIGIWYKKVSTVNRTYVWVANRQTPLANPYSSELRLLRDGNLVLSEFSETAVWSANITSNAMDSSRAVLNDKGNLVLVNVVKQPFDVYWQSFDEPTDTFLPGGRLGIDYRTNKSKTLISWKNDNDPSEGMYSLEVDPIGKQYRVLWNRSKYYWSSGSWNGQIFSEVPIMRSNHIFSINYVDNVNESYFTYDFFNTTTISRLVMDLSGQIQFFSWDTSSEQWFLFWSQPMQQCQVYAYCGAYGVCNQNSSNFCKCMEGFEPRPQTDRYIAGSPSGGCVRKNTLECDHDDFFRITNVKSPENPISLIVESADKCKSACANNCNCSAYAYIKECSIWHGDLINVQELMDADGIGGDLYVRIATQISRGKSKGTRIKVIAGSGAAIVALLVMVFLVIWGRKKMLINKGSLMRREVEELDLQIYKLLPLERATDNFSDLNKIGHGGFGAVYKGVLQTGEEIAIKRLSKTSTQGLQEFMNEVVLIAKLQHRNLVKLLGCCIEEDERMLIYEFMSNKSLDVIIFDKTKSYMLNWEKRFDIITGVARGLLYLHRDSRLTIIHRDLKAANVLLDCDMNPKISDFGMARTFKGDKTQDNTMTVAGTYGYMSPEYVTDGIFSMKSDVFSFGVLVLEIICGERNRGFHHVDHELNLLGHAWKLLNDKKALELLDPSIKESFIESEALKCIQIGLLCVQKLPKDRPTMSNVVSMLESDGAILTHPKEPGFYTERSSLVVDSSSSSHDITSTKNNASITLLEGNPAVTFKESSRKSWWIVIQEEH